MFEVSLLGRLCSYTDDPLRSGFHVESVFTRPLLSGQHPGIYRTQDRWRLSWIFKCGQRNIPVIFT